MPATQLNPRTGNRRRQPPRFTTRKKRDPSLYARLRLTQKTLHEAIVDVLNELVIMTGLLAACQARCHQLHFMFGPNPGCVLLMTIMSMILFSILKSQLHLDYPPKDWRPWSYDEDRCDCFQPLSNMRRSLSRSESVVATVAVCFV
jgi:hypothetical protein